MKEDLVPTDLPPMIREHMDEIVALARTYEVERLEVFGSVMTDRFDPERSDIDVLVTYPGGYEFGPFLARFQHLERDLGLVIGRDVDLVMDSPSLRERFRRSSAQTRTVLYGG
ncbi:MAG: nucleotidyltransferase family protein [Thermomicrobiales bacterium]